MDQEVQFVIGLGLAGVSLLAIAFILSLRLPKLIVSRHDHSYYDDTEYYNQYGLISKLPTPSSTPTNDK